MKLEPASKKTLAQEIAEQLRQAIWSGSLEPEAQLKESQLADSLQVSRGPVREALSQLEREGLVAKPPNQSAKVARLSNRDLYEVFTLRRSLEELAVEEVLSENNPSSTERLQGLVDDMKMHVERQFTEQEAADLDIRFHEALVKASMHSRLIEAWQTLEPQIYLVLLSRNVANPDYREYAVKSHQGIVDSLSGGDLELSKNIIADHIHSSYERIVEAWGDSKSH